MCARHEVMGWWVEGRQRYSDGRATAIIAVTLMMVLQDEVWLMVIPVKIQKIKTKFPFFFHVLRRLVQWL